MSIPALELHRIAKLYGQTAALKATSLQLEAGEILALLGPNGSGKTTLLKLVAGAVAPTFGGGCIFGRDLILDRTYLRSQVGFLASETYLYDDLTAEENLRFIVTMAGYRPDQATIASALAGVDLGEHRAERVGTFSSGMKRRLTLARVLLLGPQLLLLDEPYNSLDAAAAHLVDAAARRVAAEGGGVILATHDADRALALAGAVAVLERGALVYHGTPAGYRMRHAQHAG